MAPNSTERVWEELHVNIRNFVTRRVRNPADAEDVVQRVFLLVHRGLPSIRNDDRVHAWIYRTARNAVADFYRAPAQTREVLSGGATDLADAERMTGDSRGQADEQTALRELADCLQPLLRQLPDTDLEALSLTEFQGLTQAEAAHRLGLSVSGMKSRVQRARHRLKTLIEDCCRLELDRRGSIISYETRVQPIADGAVRSEQTGPRRSPQATEPGCGAEPHLR
ncbi:MAG: RNA polymerase sigma factor SigZ, partial [Acidimicrobiia bacterium]